MNRFGNAKIREAIKVLALAIGPAATQVCKAAFSSVLKPILSGSAPLNLVSNDKSTRDELSLLEFFTTLAVAHAEKSFTSDDEDDTSNEDSYFDLDDIDDEDQAIAEIAEVPKEDEKIRNADNVNDSSQFRYSEDLFGEDESDVFT